MINQRRSAARPDIKMFFISAAKYTLLCLVSGLLLYDSWFIGLLLLPGFALYLSRIRKRAEQEERLRRMAEFRDALTSLGACLEAGYSMENAAAAAEKDLACLYSGDSWIRRELSGICRAMENSVPAEEAFRGFAERSGLEEAQSFAELYTTAKRSGGDLLRIIRSAAAVVSGKTEVKREIHTILTAKRLECRVMRLIPPGILVYFRLCSPGFLDMLYEGAFGRILMTAMLLAYLFLAWLMERITEIEL